MSWSSPRSYHTLECIRHRCLWHYTRCHVKLIASSLIHCSVVDDPCHWFWIFIYRNGHVKILGLIDWLIDWKQCHWAILLLLLLFSYSRLFFHISACYAGFSQGFPTRNMLWIAGVRLVTRQMLFLSPSTSKRWREDAWAPHVNEICQKVVDIWIVNMWNGNWPLEPELPLLSAEKNINTEYTNANITCCIKPPPFYHIFYICLAKYINELQ